MGSFSDQLKIWLVANESNRRGALAIATLFALSSHFFSFKGFLVIAGLCVMIEGAAMLFSADAPKAGSR